MTSRLLLIAALGASLAGSAFAAELATKKSLTLELAKGIAEAAQSHAEANNWAVNIAILDDGGNLLYFQRMDGVQIGSIDVALRKAESAIKFKRPTLAFSDGVKSRVQLVSLPGSLAFEGGLPIEHEGQIVGSIGVSGVTAEQDGMIAKAGADALSGMLD